MQGFVKDRGYKSRKFWLAIISMGVLLAAGKFTPAATLPEIVAGIVALYTVYATGNVMTRFNSFKLLGSQQTPQQVPQEDSPKDGKNVSKD